MFWKIVIQLFNKKSLQQTSVRPSVNPYFSLRNFKSKNHEIWYNSDNTSLNHALLYDTFPDASLIHFPFFFLILIYSMYIIVQLCIDFGFVLSGIRIYITRNLVIPNSLLIKFCLQNTYLLILYHGRVPQFTV